MKHERRLAQSLPGWYAGAMIRLAQFRDPVLVAVLLALAPVAVLAPKGTVVLLAIGALAIVLGQPLGRTFDACRRSGYAWLVLALAFWSLFGLWWALAPGGGFNLWLRVVVIMFAGLLWLDRLARLPPAATARLERAVALFGAVLGALLAFELVSDLALTRMVRLGAVPAARSENLLARGAVLLAIFAWPVALVYWRRFGGLAALAWLAAVFVLLLALPMFAAVVALAAGSAIFLLAYRWPRATIRAVLWGLLVALVALPMALAIGDAGQDLWEAFPDAPPSWRHRLAVWQFVADRLAEKPLMGWGLDAARNLPGADSPVYLKQGLMPLHPHSAILQVWLELGLPGAVLLGALIVLVVKGIAPLDVDPRAAAGRLATFVTFFVPAALSFGMWQNWWLASGWIAAFVAALAARSARPSRLGHDP